MENAKKEFLEEVERYAKKRVFCASIEILGRLNQKYERAKKTIVKLNVNYTKEEYDDFLSKLDVEYDDGYGGQELFGTIWYADGSWSERGEYDGSEWWEYKETPSIPSELMFRKN